MFEWLCRKRKMRKSPINNEIHYTECDMSVWRWDFFTPKEIASKGDGLIMVNENAMDKYQAFRVSCGVPHSPNSAYRSEDHNRAVGGAKNSFHLKGEAFDVPIKIGMDRESIHYHAKKAGFTGIGDYNTFVHIDTGPKRYWDNRG